MNHVCKSIMSLHLQISFPNISSIVVGHGSLSMLGKSNSTTSASIFSKDCHVLWIWVLIFVSWTCLLCNSTFAVSFSSNARSTGEHWLMWQVVLWIISQHCIDTTCMFKTCQIVCGFQVYHFWHYARVQAGGRVNAIHQHPTHGLALNVSPNRKSLNWPFSPTNFFTMNISYHLMGSPKYWLAMPIVAPAMHITTETWKYLRHPWAEFNFPLKVRFFCQQCYKICCLFRTPPPLGPLCVH